ncbi:hypothetical protein MA11_gp32 [Pectobacterium phage MA11]|uniref:hypothetical protein n=1 Tax=Pectobacterium phage MA11 TaxID=2662283 RepID=UPI0012A9E33B|nr:hypothetical protein JT356_gp32 [Pectobacterium phage MA11]QGF21058.1 hypothetical protein MA11_gp32 [Pectobacterium phage MA11]
MKYIFFRDTDVTLAQYNSLRTNETPLTITTMEHGWIMLRADDDAFEPPFPHVDIEHVYTTFIKMPAGPKIQLRIDTEAHPTLQKEIDEQRKVMTREALAAKTTAREVGYHSYLQDRKDGDSVSANPYRDPTLAREWEAGREKARTEFDPSGPEELTEAKAWEKAFQEGAKAAKLGLFESKNPHVARSPDYRAWRDGFRSVRNREEVGLQEDDPVENDSPTGPDDAPGFVPGGPINVSVFEGGVIAAKTGYGLQVNPFVARSADWRSWREGWHSVMEKPARD